MDINETKTSDIKHDGREPAYTGQDSVTDTTKEQITFHKYFKDHLKEINKQQEDALGWVKITRSYIAEQLGYVDPKANKRGTKIITNNLNESVRTANRDRMLAIFIICGFSVEETNRALELYGMSKLMDDDIRDAIIRLGLENHDDYHKICERLKDVTGVPLQIGDDSAPVKIEDISNKYDVISDNIYYGDFVGDRSLTGMYDPDALAFTERIVLQDKEGNLYRLNNDEGCYDILYDYEDGVTEHQMGFDFKECYLMDAPAILTWSDKRILNKRKDVLAVLDDTRNYIIRYDVSVTSNDIHIFTESFDYDYPEQMRYFQFTWSKSTWNLTVTHNSQFLYHHLGTDRYSKFYRKTPVFEPLEEYEAPGSIKSKYDIRVYKRILESIKQLLLDIGSGTVLIADPYIDFSDDPARSLTDFYGIKDKFKWIFDDNYPEYYPETWECTVDINGAPFTITFDSLMDAYKKGIRTIDDLYSITQEYGDTESYFQSYAKLIPSSS